MNIYIDKSNGEIYKKSSLFLFTEINDFIILTVYKKIKLNFPNLNDFEEDGDISVNNIQIRKFFVFNSVITNEKLINFSLLQKIKKKFIKVYFLG